MVAITPGEVHVVRTAGKLTFKPLSGGYFRCLQLKRLGKLSRADKESIRNQIGPLFQGLEPSKQERYIPTLFLHSYPKWVCPECGHKNHNFHTDDSVTSCSCGMKYLLKRVPGAKPRLPMATKVGMIWSLNYLCPHCQRINSGLVPKYPHDCDYCLQTFMVP